MTPRPRRLVLGAVLCASLAWPAAAADWGRKLDGLQELLERREWKEAAERGARLREDLVAHFEDAGSTPQLIAQTLVLQAIAEANLGRDEKAVWHWQTAENYLEGLAETDLSAYGRAAEVMASESPAATPAAAGAPEPGKRRNRYREVKVRTAVQPSYPKSLRKTGQEGHVVVRVIVGVDGKAHQPLVKEAGIVPTMAFPALEALQGWRFTPAERDGRPVAVYYELRIRYGQDV